MRIFQHIFRQICWQSIVRQVLRLSEAEQLTYEKVVYMKYFMLVFLFGILKSR